MEREAKRDERPPRGSRDLGNAEESGRQRLKLAQGLALELHGQRKRALRATLDASLDGDLGFDSLARVERAFGVRLPIRWRS